MFWKKKKERKIIKIKQNKKGGYTDSYIRQEEQ